MDLNKEVNFDQFLKKNFYGLQRPHIKNHLNWTDLNPFIIPKVGTQGQLLLHFRVGNRKQNRGVLLQEPRKHPVRRSKVNPNSTAGSWAPGAHPMPYRRKEGGEATQQFKNGTGPWRGRQHTQPSALLISRNEYVCVLARTLK